MSNLSFSEETRNLILEKLEENSFDESLTKLELVDILAPEYLNSVDTEELLRDSIDDEGPVKICGLSFIRSRIIEELDSIAFNCMVNDFSDAYTEIDGEYYEESDIDSLTELIEETISELIEENEEKEE